jgi:hypothetical protein
VAVTGRLWDEQPLEVVQANEGYPGLRHFWNFGDGSGRCLITGARLVGPGTAAAAIWVPGGLYLAIAGWITTPATLPLAVDVQLPITVVVGVKNYNGSGVDWGIMNPVWTGLYGSAGSVVSTNATDFSGVTSPIPGPAMHRAATYYAVTMREANNLRSIANGGPIAIDTACAAPAPTAPNSTIYLGAANAGGSAPADLLISHIAIIQGGVRDEELQVLSREPWARLLAPRRSVRPSIAASGSGLPTLTSLGISGITTTGAILTTNA